MEENITINRQQELSIEKFIILTLDFLFLPSKSTINELRQFRIGFRPFVIFILSIFTFSLSTNILINKSSLQTTFVFFFLLLFLSIGKIISFSAWIHFITGIYDKCGDIKFFINTLFLSYTPLFLSLPLINISFLTCNDNPMFLYILVLLLIFLSIGLNIFIAVKENYLLTTRDAITFIILPVFIINVLIIVFIIGIIGLLYFMLF
jgi:hypothetical protein